MIHYDDFLTEDDLALMKELVKLTIQERERLAKQSLIGSTIKDIKLEPIPRRKHMFLLTILTTAVPIRFGNRVLCTNEIRVKVKM